MAFGAHTRSRLRKMAAKNGGIACIVDIFLFVLFLVDTYANAIMLLGYFSYIFYLLFKSDHLFKMDITYGGERRDDTWLEEQEFLREHSCTFPDQCNVQAKNMHGELLWRKDICCIPLDFLNNMIALGGSGYLMIPIAFLVEFVTLFESRFKQAKWYKNLQEYAKYTFENPNFEASRIACLFFLGDFLIGGIKDDEPSLNDELSTAIFETMAVIDLGFAAFELQLGPCGVYFFFLLALLFRNSSSHSCEKACTPASYAANFALNRDEDSWSRGWCQYFEKDRLTDLPSQHLINQQDNYNYIFEVGQCLMVQDEGLGGNGLLGVGNIVTPPQNDTSPCKIICSSVSPMYQNFIFIFIGTVFAVGSVVILFAQYTEGWGTVKKTVQDLIKEEKIAGEEGLLCFEYKFGIIGGITSYYLIVLSPILFGLDIASIVWNKCVSDNGHEGFFLLSWIIQQAKGYPYSVASRLDQLEEGTGRSHPGKNIIEEMLPSPLDRIFVKLFTGDNSYLNSLDDDDDNNSEGNIELGEKKSRSDSTKPGKINKKIEDEKKRSKQKQASSRNKSDSGPTRNARVKKGGGREKSGGRGGRRR